MGGLLGELGGGAPLIRVLKVMKGRLWGWASPFMGAQLGNLEWVHLPGTLKYGWKGLWRWSLSLCGSSVKGNCREGSSTRDFERWMYGALGMECLSLKRFYGGGLRGAPSLGTLEYMLRKSPDTGISLHGGPFPSEGNLVCGRDLYTGNFDRWMMEGLVGGHLSARDSMKGTLREGSFTGEPERWGFWERCKMSCKWASLSIGALLGNLERFRLLGLLREKKSISGFLFGPRGY